MIDKVLVHGKAMNRTVLGIANAYLKINPNATLSDLNKAFPIKLNAANQVSKIFWERSAAKRKMKDFGNGYEPFFLKDDEIIILKDGTKVAMFSMWQKNDFASIVEHAKQFGIQVASFEKAETLKRGEFRLEYLNGFVPNKGKKKPWWLLILLLLLLGAGLYFFLCKDKPAEPIETIQTLIGQVENVDGGSLPNVNVTLQNGENIEVLPVNEDGTFKLVLDPDTKYTIKATCEGFLDAVKTIKTKKEGVKDYNVSLALASVKAPILIDNIFFDVDKATLKEVSEKSLNNLVAILNNNPKVTIEINAFTDATGSEEHNKTLSQERSQSVVDYLISKGIAKERLEAKGYGSVPKTITAEMAKKHNWMTEGKTLSEKFIAKLDKEKQEICHQYNRRTEFKVLTMNYQGN